MSRRSAAGWFLVAAAGYVVFMALFSRFSNASAWDVALSPVASIAAASDAASRLGVDVSGWRSETEVREDRRLMDHLDAVGSDELRRGISIYVAFRDPASSRRVGVRLDSAGRPTAVIVRGEELPESTPVPPDVTARAEAAFRAFVPDSSAYRKVGEDPLAGVATRLRWEAPGNEPNIMRRASVVVRGGTVKEIRYGEEVVDRVRPASDVVDNVRDVGVISAVLFGLILYVLGSIQRAIPQRLVLITAAIVYLLLFGNVMAEMDPSLSAMFAESPGQSRWVLALVLILFALPMGLALMGGYQYLARSRPRQLATWESLLLRGRLGSSAVGSSMLVGLAAGGWIVAIPHLLRATGVFGDYVVSDGSVDAIYRSGLTPASLFGDFVLATVTFGTCVPFVLARLSRRIAVPIAFLIALTLFAQPQDPLAASAAGSIIVTLVFFTLFERRDLLAVVMATLGASWAAAAATRLVQTADVVRHEGMTAMFTLAGAALVFAAVAVRGSKAPHAAWQPPPARVERKRMQREFEVARLAQERMLPDEAPALAGISIASYCQPARQVGGDLYDFVTMGDGRVGIAVADVSGKGVPAALIMTITKGLLLAAADGESDPRAILGGVNAGIHSLKQRSTFVTMIFGVLNANERTFEFVRAGHTALLWRRHDGSVSSLAPRGIGLGMSAPRMFRAVSETRTIAPSAGDFLLLYSDGVTEAMNERSEEFGDDRLLEIARTKLTPEMSADDARDALIGEVALFCGTAPVHDDMTMVVVKFD